MRKFIILFKIQIPLLGSFLFGFLNCSDIERPDIATFLLPSGGNRIGIVSSDFAGSGRFSTMTKDGIPLPGYAPIHSDAIATYQNSRIYILNRLGRDSIQALNPAIGYFTDREFSTGEGSNPQDFIYVSENEAYISLYERDYLLIVNPLTGIEIGRIPLSAYAESTANPDGLPEAAAMFLEGNFLYVALQRLDRNSPEAGTVFPPTEKSILVEIDIRTRSIIQTYDFPATNPFGRFRRISYQGRPHIIIPAAGYLGFQSQLDGGLAAFDLQNRNFQPRLLYHEEVADGDILDVVIKNDETGYASILNADFSKSIQRFNPTTGQRLNELAFYPPQSGTVGGMLLTEDGLLYTGDASFENPGILIFDTNRSDQRLNAAPITSGLRPFQIIEVPGQ